MPETKTYTVIKGDTLWLIAYSMLGNAERWPEIYALNAQVIEAEIKKRFRKPKADPQNWIFPSTVLRLPEMGDGT